MMAGILMAGGALIGLGWVSTLGMFYLFYFLMPSATCAEAPYPIKFCCRAGSTDRAEKPWALLISESGSGARRALDFPRVGRSFRLAVGLAAAGLLIVVVSLPLAFW